MIPPSTHGHPFLEMLLSSIGVVQVDAEQLDDVNHLFQVCAKGLERKCPTIYAAYMASFFRHNPATFHALIPWIKLFQRRRRIWAELRTKAQVPSLEKTWHGYIQKYPRHHEDHKEAFMIIYEFAPFITYYRTITHDYILLMMPALGEPKNLAEIPWFLNELIDVQTSINELLLPIWFDEREGI